jgi:hypothetical protein
MRPIYYLWNRTTDEISTTNDAKAWGQFAEQIHLRIVANTNFPWPDEEQRLVISTVFLGLDHNFSADGPPILFETMVFLSDKEADGMTKRYATAIEARAGHEETVTIFQKIREAYQEDTEVLHTVFGGES